MRRERFSALFRTTSERPDWPLSRQRGQSVVLVAVALIVLVLFVAIAVDASDAYVHRRTAQNAADAAALAGGQELGKQFNDHLYSGTLIKTDMNNFAEQNDIPDTNGVPADAQNKNVVGYYLDRSGNRLSETPIGSPYDSSILPNVWGIEAVTTITAPTFFGGIIGLDGMPVHASAAVMLQGVCGHSCVVPIATNMMDFEATEGNCYNIWNGDGPGNFGWLNWSVQGSGCDTGGDTCSAQCLEQNLAFGTCRSGLIKVGDWVGGSTGVANAAFIRNTLRYDYIDPQRHFAVVVWDETNEGAGCGRPDGGLWYHVTGFAEMQLLGYDLSQGLGQAAIYDTVDFTRCQTLGFEPHGGVRLTARFIRWVSGEPGDCDPHGSLLTPRLVR